MEYIYEMLHQTATTFIFGYNTTEMLDDIS